MAPLATLLGLAATAAAAVLAAVPAPDGMVAVPAGPAVLGGTAHTGLAGPQSYPVAGFLIDRHEVTNAEYAAFVAATGHARPAFADEPEFSAPDQPVTGIGWEDARAYCAWAGKRLPTEIEWEKAARGASGRLYPWGSEFDPARAHLSGDAPLAVTATQGDESPYGARGMAGNVSEWVADTDSVRGGVCGPPHGAAPSENGLALAELAAIYGVTRPEICSTADIPETLAPTERCAFIKGNNWSGLSHMTVSSNRMWDYTDAYADFVGFRCARDG